MKKGELGTVSASTALDTVRYDATEPGCSETWDLVGGSHSCINMILGDLMFQPEDSVCCRKLLLHCSVPQGSDSASCVVIL